MIAYLSLGANLGNRLLTIDQACKMLQAEAGVIVNRSRPYYSPAWGFDSKNEFCNICIAIDTPLCPTDLLTLTQDMERRLGRSTKSHDGHYHDRTIDIDILLYEHCEVNLPYLTIPHPLMWQRDFVMIPLREILPEVDTYVLPSKP